jgi:hypothetical protein
VACKRQDINEDCAETIYRCLALFQEAGLAGCCVGSNHDRIVSSRSCLVEGLAKSKALGRLWSHDLRNARSRYLGGRCYESFQPVPVESRVGLG